jgi:ribosome biogenesis protein Nip4
LLVLDNINAAKYRQKILQPFFEELHADELQEGYFQQNGKIRGKIEEINNAPNMLENVINALKSAAKKKVDISSTSFNKLINLCVNCNCVNFYHNSCHAVNL